MAKAMSSGDVKVFFFAAVTKRLKTVVGKSKNQVKDQINKRNINKRNVILFKCWSPNKFDIEMELIPNQKRYFRLDRIHFFLLKKASRRFLEENNL